MKIIYYKLVIIFILTCLLYSCDETTGSTKTKKRYIYYSLSESDSVPASDAGLYRYDVNNGEIKRLANNSVIFISAGSKDATIGFEYRGLEQIHWIYSPQKGNIPLPYPISTEEKYYYWIYDIPYISQNYNGNKFAYFVGYRKKNTSDIYKDKPKLIIMDFLNSSTKIIEIDEICKSLIKDTSIEGVQPFSDYILSSNDGKKVWFLMNSFDISGHSDVVNIAISDFMLLEYYNDKIIPFIKPDYRIKQILGADYSNDRIFVMIVSLVDSTIYAYNNIDSIPVNIPYENFSNPEQFAKEKSEMVGWSDYGISIYDLSTMSVKQNVISWGKIDEFYPGLSHKKNKRLSFSPDAEYITFALQSKYSNYNYDLFVIKRDGTEFKRISKNAPVGIPVVSSVIQD
ncbi:MAG: hypothetical protein EPN82_00875 [Bacteroidetes bacterium]|nr:MAG: hypothetical protein EPN82_00875 [Bacteroidota bacterium]